MEHRHPIPSTSPSSQPVDPILHILEHITKVTSTSPEVALQLSHIFVDSDGQQMMDLDPFLVAQAHVSRAYAFRALKLWKKIEAECQQAEKWLSNADAEDSDFLREFKNKLDYEARALLSHASHAMKEKESSLDAHMSQTMPSNSAHLSLPSAPSQGVDSTDTNTNGSIRYSATNLKRKHSVTLSSFLPTPPASQEPSGDKRQRQHRSSASP